MFAKFINRVRKTVHHAGKCVRSVLEMHPSIRRYLRFNKAAWVPQQVRSGDAVVLVGLFTWHPSIHTYAKVTNFLARQAGARIEWFYFHKGRMPLYERIFASFGARRGLCYEILVRDSDADDLANQLYAGLKTKWDVVNLAVDGVVIGDLIYDTYLRSGPKATVDLRDPKLREVIQQALQIFFSIRKYFAQNRVVAVIPDHIVYLYSGMMVRMALVARIPVYLAFLERRFALHRIELDPSGSQIPTGRPYSQYRQLFNQLSPGEKMRARQMGREELERRLSGRGTELLRYGSGYAHAQSGRVFPEPDGERILILLHDFCDAVHNYRHMLFPDFYEWIHFLLARAEETPFEWYVKPHPNLLCEDIPGRSGLIRCNTEVIAELKARYPRIHFLEPTVSNRLIMEEGIRAMFTVYGTGGHEFAFRGIPVVNAGDNPHSAYDFNLHPQTLEDYEHCIRNANALPIEIRKEEIEEYVYMNYFYSEEHGCAEVSALPTQFFDSEDARQGMSRPETFDHLTYPLEREHERKLDEYLEVVTSSSPSAWANGSHGTPQSPSRQQPKLEPTRS